MSDVIGKALVYQSYKPMDEMDSKRSHPKKKEDKHTYGNMEKEIPEHFVEDYESKQGAVGSMLSSNFAAFTSNHGFMSSIKFSNYICIETFIHS